MGENDPLNVANHPREGGFDPREGETDQRESLLLVGANAPLEGEEDCPEQPEPLLEGRPYFFTLTFQTMYILQGMLF